MSYHTTHFRLYLPMLAFFSIAFYHSPDAFMAQNWTEIALVDYSFKLIISLGLFVPLYGVLLNYLINKLTTLKQPTVADVAGVIK